VVECGVWGLSLSNGQIVHVGPLCTRRNIPPYLQDTERFVAVDRGALLHVGGDAEFDALALVTLELRGIRSVWYVKVGGWEGGVEEPESD
jgi:hypothetical protein